MAINLGSNEIKKISVGSNEINKISLGTTTVWEGIYVAQDSDFYKVNNLWIYRGSELEVEIPKYINGTLVTTIARMFCATSPFYATNVTRVVLNHSHVERMTYTFNNNSASTLDLSHLNTVNVTRTDGSFSYFRGETLDLSGLNMSGVSDTANMFYGSKATTGYARTQADADKFNSSSFKPATLNFVVKP